MIRFLADASLRDAIVRGCRRREPALDFLSANGAKLEGVPDPDVLALCDDSYTARGTVRALHVRSDGRGSIAERTACEWEDEPNHFS